MVGVSMVITVAAFSRYTPILGCMAELDLGTQVTSPRGKQLHPLDNVHSGQFAFTSKELGKYVAYFWLQSAHPNVHLNLVLDWKTGVGAKDWESIAKKEKLDVWPIIIAVQVFLFKSIVSF
jgi:hypothetical protein